MSDDTPQTDPYARYVERARAAIPKRQPSEPECTTLRQILWPVISLMRSLSKAGLVELDTEQTLTNGGIEFRWRLPSSRLLVAHCLLPIVNDGTEKRARIVVGISREDNAFVGMPLCGMYVIPKSEEDGLKTQWVILEGIADLVGENQI